MAGGAERRVEEGCGVAPGGYLPNILYCSTRLNALLLLKILPLLSKFPFLNTVHFTEHFIIPTLPFFVELLSTFTQHLTLHRLVVLFNTLIIIALNFTDKRDILTL